MANQKLGNLENLGNIIPSFLMSEFSLLPYSQNRKLEKKMEKNLNKISEISDIFEVPEFST